MMVRSVYRMEPTVGAWRRPLTGSANPGSHDDRASRRYVFFTCQTANVSPPAETSRAGAASLIIPACARASLSSPNDGGRSAETAPGACEAPVGVPLRVKTRVNALLTRHAGTLARRPASPCDRERAPLGAPPWRFLGLRVRVSGSGILLRSACSDAPRSRVVVSGERFPCLPGLRLRAAAAERHSLLRL